MISKKVASYIQKNHPIKRCLKLGIVNLSSLSRIISDELDLPKGSEHAIIASLRRIKVSPDEHLDKKINQLWKRSQFTLKNKVAVLTLDRGYYMDLLMEQEKKIRGNKDLFFTIEGTKTFTIITEEKHIPDLKKLLNRKIIKIKKELSLITFTSPGIADIPGAVTFITGLFYEQGVNIVEFMSCHDDTLIVIDTTDIKTVLDFIR